MLEIVVIEAIVTVRVMSVVLVTASIVVALEIAGSGPLVLVLELDTRVEAASETVWVVPKVLVIALVVCVLKVVAATETVWVTSAILVIASVVDELAIAIVVSIEPAVSGALVLVLELDNNVLVATEPAGVPVVLETVSVVLVLDIAEEAAIASAVLVTASPVVALKVGAAEADVVISAVSAALVADLVDDDVLVLEVVVEIVCGCANWVTLIVLSACWSSVLSGTSAATSSIVSFTTRSIVAVVTVLATVTTRSNSSAKLATASGTLMVYSTSISPLNLRNDVATKRRAFWKVAIT
jgi:hypothetical protein